MSHTIIAGTAVLAAILFTPASLGTRLAPGDVSLQRDFAAPTIGSPQVGLGAGQGVFCQGRFGPVGSAWALHRDWTACPGLGGEDHPHVSLDLRNGPPMSLDFVQGEAAPHDDF